jgi:hypothetical protein
LAKRKTTVATAITLVNQQPKNIASPAQWTSKREQKRNRRWGCRKA